MKLADLLAALSNNTNVDITLLDSKDIKLITFNAAGYVAVESALGKRDVKRIKITSATNVFISVEDEETPTPDPDPEEPETNNDENSGLDPESP